MSAIDRVDFPPLPIFPFDPRKEGLERWFGPQEAAIMAALWANGQPHTVKWTWRQIEYKKLAYTTVMTTMTRLWSKGVLNREKISFSYTYRVRETREQFEARQTAALLASLEIEP